MIYTYKRGVDKQLKQRIIRSGGLTLPIVSLVFLVIAALSFNAHHSSGQSPNIPLQAKSSQSSSSKSKAPSTNIRSKKSSTDQNVSSGGISLGSDVKPAMSFGSLSSPVSQPVISVPTPTVTSGGLGGGDITPSGGGGSTSSGGTPSTGSGGSTSNPPAPTVVCTNLLSLAQVCTACTPPLTLQPGQKALLASDGTCTSVN